MSSNSSTTGASGLLVQLEGTATATVDVTACLFRGNRTAALTAIASNSSSLTVVANAMEVARTDGLGNEGIVVSNRDDAQVTATIRNSSFTYFPGSAVRIGQASGAASALSLLRATINNNSIETGDGATAPSIAGYLSSTSGQVATDCSSPRIRSGIDNSQPAIVVTTPDPGSSPAVDVTITNNHVDMSEYPSGSGVRGTSGIVVRSTQTAANVCANILSNSSHWFPLTVGPGGGISRRTGQRRHVQAGARIREPGYSGGDRAQHQ